MKSTINIGKRAGQAAIDLVLLPAALILFILKYFFRIQLVRVRSRRLGPMGGVDIFLRRRKLGLIPSSFRPLGLATKKVANPQLLKMFRRVMPILQLPQPTPLRVTAQYLATKSLLSRLRLFYELKFAANEFYELNATTSSLSFTPEEEAQGRKLLAALNVDSWYICFHARDAAYADRLLGKRDRRHDFRNCDIANYLPAAEYVVQHGGSALRMGSLVATKLSSTHPRIVDYATLHRSDFGDIYLPAKCKFFLGNTAGLNTVPYILNVPCAMANVIPITRCPPPGKKDLFIPKKIWCSTENRFLTFKEMITRPEILAWQYGRFQEEDGLIPVENTAEEILELTKEMYERLEGTWKTTEEDEGLQQKFKSLFVADPHSYGFPSRIGAKFLRENKGLLD